MFRMLARLSVAGAVLVGSTVTAALPASAHVSVQPSTAIQGGFSAISFRVPTERDDARTTAIVAEAAIGPGEYDDFSVSVGFLPEDDQMVFKAVQTYDSGEVVRWIEEAAEGSDEPEHPAPTLELTPPVETDGTDTATDETGDSDAAPAAGTSDAAGDDQETGDGLLLGLGVVALLLGGAGAVLGGLAYRRAS